MAHLIGAVGITHHGLKLFGLRRLNQWHSGAKLSPIGPQRFKIVDGRDSIHPILLELCAKPYISGVRHNQWTLSMITILYILTGFAFACVVLTLVMGTVAMSKKSEENRKKSNTWMWRRIYAQVAAIVLLALTVYMRSKGA